MSAGNLNHPLGESAEAQSWALESLSAVLCAAAECMGAEDLQHRDRAARLLWLGRQMVCGWIAAVDARMEAELHACSRAQQGGAA